VSTANPNVLPHAKARSREGRKPLPPRAGEGWDGGVRDQRSEVRGQESEKPFHRKERKETHRAQRRNRRHCEQSEAIQRFFVAHNFLDCFALLAMTAFYIHAKARSREGTKAPSPACGRRLGWGRQGSEVRDQNVEARFIALCLFMDSATPLRFAQKDGFFFCALCVLCG